MGLLSEIIKALKEKAGTGTQYTVLEGQGGYFMNVKKILEFSPERIVVKGANGRYSIEGKELFIRKYFEGDLSIKGNIRKVAREEE